jgi:hypothetical protein
MSEKNAETRRSFLKSGALLAAPLVPSAVMTGEDLKARVKRLENEAAIRELHQEWLRQVNNRAAAGAEAFDSSVVGIAADHAGEPDAIEVAAGGRNATGTFYCSVEFATPIPRDTTLAQMAHAQGGGFMRRSERRVVKVEYAKTNGAWAIAKVEVATA